MENEGWPVCRLVPGGDGLYKSISEARESACKKPFEEGSQSKNEKTMSSGEKRMENR